MALFTILWSLLLVASSSSFVSVECIGKSQSFQSFAAVPSVPSTASRSVTIGELDSLINSIRTAVDAPVIASAPLPLPTSKGGNGVLVSRGIFTPASPGPSISSFSGRSYGGPATASFGATYSSNSKGSIITDTPVATPSVSSFAGRMGGLPPCGSCNMFTKGGGTTNGVTNGGGSTDVDIVIDSNNNGSDTVIVDETNTSDTIQTNGDVVDVTVPATDVAAVPPPATASFASYRPASFASRSSRMSSTPQVVIRSYSSQRGFPISSNPISFNVQQSFSRSATPSFAQTDAVLLPSKGLTTFVTTPIKGGLINGINGGNGFNGINGGNGFNGINGGNGFNGINGDGGFNGINGDGGFNGINGDGGFNGVNGGSNGFNGVNGGSNGYTNGGGGVNVVNGDGGFNVGNKGFNGVNGGNGYNGIDGGINNGFNGGGNNGFNVGGTNGYNGYNGGGSNGFNGGGNNGFNGGSSGYAGINTNNGGGIGGRSGQWTPSNNYNNSNAGFASTSNAFLSGKGGDAVLMGASAEDSQNLSTDAAAATPQTLSGIVNYIERRLEKKQ